jgi:uncharacterized protein (UPF0332 family)
MKQDVEKHLRIAEETVREMEHLMAEGLHKAVVKRTYHAMLNAATAALLAREIQSGTRQAIVSEFSDVFVKTGLLDEKFHRYFRQAFNSRAESDDSSFASVDHRQAQANLLKVKEFIKACRVLCD